MDTLPRRIAAAVLLLIFERQDETYVVLTKRTDGVATHKGQISLPGGAREPDDATLLQTALRETEEELGLRPDQIEVLGQLPDVPTGGSNFTITPFTGRLSEPPSYRPDPAEVAEVIEVPLSALRNPDLFYEEEREEPEGNRTVYFFHCGDHIIWGATAKILKTFLESS